MINKIFQTWYLFFSEHGTCFWVGVPMYTSKTHVSILFLSLSCYNHCMDTVLFFSVLFHVLVILESLWAMYMYVRIFISYKRPTWSISTQLYNGIHFFKVNGNLIRVRIIYNKYNNTFVIHATKTNNKTKGEILCEIICFISFLKAFKQKYR